MSVGVEVDALALMLDGAREYLAYRFGPANMRVLEAGKGIYNKIPTMRAAVDRPEWAEVAEAILELEGYADWRPAETYRPPLMESGLAVLALEKSGLWDIDLGRFGSVDEAYLEAAALLRDGWRPRKRSKR